MLRTLAHFFLLAAFAAPMAWSQGAAEAWPSYDDVAHEIHFVELPGPGPNEHRIVYVWRPPNAPRGPLPVLYTADGVYGIYVAIAGLREPIRAGLIPPIVVVGLQASETRRLREYVPWRGSNRYFDAHERWLIETVMPWAERVAGASSDPNKRVIGGYSNGADFALALAMRHPELFAGVLAHSPVNSSDFRAPAQGGPRRWVLTAGRYEFENGEIIDIIDRLGEKLRAQPNHVRRCAGAWDHVGRAWRNVSPGSVAWLFDFPGAEMIASPTERETCTNRDPPVPASASNGEQ